MKKSEILDFFIIYISLSTLKISSKLETWSPKPIRFGMERPIYVYIVDFLFSNKFYSKPFRTESWTVLYIFNTGGQEYVYS